MEKKFITIQEAASLLSISERAIQIRVNRKQLEAQSIPSKGRGGKQYLIALDSLPEEAQERYKAQNSIAAPMEIFSEEVVRTYTEEKRNKALWKFNILAEYAHSELSGQEFVSLYNSEHSEKITYRMLAYWSDKYRSEGIVGLIDKRKCLPVDSSCISSEVWDVFYALYMTPQKRSVQLCYDKTKAYFKRTAPDMKFPSYPTFTKKVREIPQYAILAFRGGKKALADLMPYMERNYEELVSNQCWVSDHHLADVFVRNKRGKIVRPWITAYQDAWSRKIIACLVRDASPNATAIKQALRIGVTEYGIPDEVYTDNGKDYLSSEFSPDSPNSILNVLGIHRRKAKPYHGQSKPIERFFRTLEERFGKLFYSYVGSDGKDRPEHMQKPKKELEKDTNIPTIDEYTERLAAYIKEYNATPHSGNGMEGETPDHVYYNSFVKQAQIISDERILRILFGNNKECKVTNSGVTVCGIRFTSEELLEHLNKKMIARYDPNDLSRVYIYTLQGKFVCQADAKVRSPFRAAEEADFIRASKYTKRVNKLLKENEPQRRKDISDILFESIAEEHRYQMEHTEEFESETIEEARKAVSDVKEEKRFNPYAELYDINHKKGVI